MKFSGNLTVKDYLNANKLHFFKSFRYKLILISIISLFLISLILFYLSNYNFFTGKLLIRSSVLFFAIWIVIQNILIQISTRKTWFKNLTVNDTLNFIADKDGLKVNSLHIDALIEWHKFIYFLENKNILLLYHNKNSFTMIPKRWINDESINEIKNYLKCPEKKITGKQKILIILSVIFIIIIVFKINIKEFKISNVIIKNNSKKIIKSLNFQLNDKIIKIKDLMPGNEILKNINVKNKTNFSIEYKNKKYYLLDINPQHGTFIEIKFDINGKLNFFKSDKKQLF